MADKLNSRLDYTSTDPKKITSYNRQQIATTGNDLMAQNQQRAARQEGLSRQTQDYLGNIESPLAEGQGGYNPDELSQIRMTPEQQQQMVTGAGISAGTNTAASVGAAQRAANAAGGNPMALAAYRARAAQQEGAQAGDAMTQARVAASNAAADRAANIGQTRIGQQTQGLNYYQGLQGQQNQNAQQGYQNAQQAYGTQTSGLIGGEDVAQKASQNPTTFDKVMGGIGGALSFLDEGDVASGETPAVVGENGPEKVGSLDKGGADMMADGGFGNFRTPSLAATPNSPDYLDMVNSAPSDGNTSVNPDGSLTFSPGGSPGTQSPSFMSNVGAGIKSRLMGEQQPPLARASGRDDGRTPTAMDDIKSFGEGIGNVARSFLEDGGVTPRQGRDGIFTKPTQVMLGPNEAVVPLNYRAGAKVRPSFAALPAAKTRPAYGGYGG